MADAPRADASPGAATQPAKRKLGIETVLAVAGALAVIGFFLPWLDLPADGERVSGFDAARAGGIMSGLFAIPVLGLMTAVLGGLRWRLSRYAGGLTAIAMLAPVAYLLVTNWPWLYAIPLAIGVAALVLGKLGRAPWLNLPAGGVLMVLSVAAPLLAWADRLPDFATDLGILPAIPLLGLALLMPLCAAWLLWSALRKNKRERALAITGYAIIALTVYVAALVAFGPTLNSAGIGLWMTAVGGAVLLLTSRPLASRRKQQPKVAATKRADAKQPAPEAATKRADAAPAAPKPKAPKAETKDAAPKARAPKAKTDATPKTKTDAAPKDGEAPAPKPSPADAEKLAKLELLKKKKLELLRARKRAADKEEQATAKAGAALADEPEPVFAADPTAAPAPENEDREALMQRMGVKAPPPPSDSDLEDMLAALKKRAGAED